MSEEVNESSRLLPPVGEDVSRRCSEPFSRRGSDAIPRRISEAFTALTPVVACNIPQDKSGAERDDEEEGQVEAVVEDEETDHSTLAILTVIPVVLIGVFVANADSSLVVAASQKVSSEFDALESASWLVTSYSLAQCASQPLYGKLSTIFGRKSNLAVCYFFFALGCLICGIGTQFWQVITGRVISGIGGSGMTALVTVIIADMVPVRKIAAWGSYVNLIATVGRSLGGPVGGWLTDTIGWRWSFLGQVPLTVAGLLLLLWKLPDRRNSSKHIESEQSMMQKVKRIDIGGAVSLSLTITSFLLTLDFATKSSPWYVSVTGGVIIVLLATAFYVIERYRAKEPILPLELLTKRVAWTSYLLVGVQLTAQSDIFYSTPIYFQISANVSVANAGMRLVPAVVGNASGGIISGLIISKTGRYKVLTICASIFATIGYTLILIRWTGSTSWWETSYIFLGGFGMGIIQSATFVHLAANLDQEDMAIAGTTHYLSQNVFGVVGIQTSTAVFHTSVVKLLNQSLGNIPQKDKVISRALSSIAYIRMLPQTTRLKVVQAYVESLRFTFSASVVAASIGILLGVSIQEKKMQ